MLVVRLCTTALMINPALAELAAALSGAATA
jgi:hypothetical protein